MYHRMAEDDPKLLIFLPDPPCKACFYNHAQFDVVLGMEPRETSTLLTELHLIQSLWKQKPGHDLLLETCLAHTIPVYKLQSLPGCEPQARNHFFSFELCVLVCVCPDMLVEVQTTTVEVSSLLPLCGRQGSNSGGQAWWCLLSRSPRKPILNISAIP